MTVEILGFLFFLAMSVMFFISAMKIGKGNIGLIHDYHWRNVKEEDKMKYCKELSKGMYVISFGILLSGIFSYIGNNIGVPVCLFGGIGIGFGIFHMAQKKYNGSWFSG